MTGEDVAARVHAYAWTDRKPGLERTRALLAALGNPEKALKFVHITGSNGKGLRTGRDARPPFSRRLDTARGCSPRRTSTASTSAFR